MGGERPLVGHFSYMVNFCPFQKVKLDLGKVLPSRRYVALLYFASVHFSATDVLPVATVRATSRGLGGERPSLPPSPAVIRGHRRREAFPPALSRGTRGLSLLPLPLPLPADFI